MCKFMHLAHSANKTRVDHDNILGIITSMLKSECHDNERMLEHVWITFSPMTKISQAKKL
jgi:hypothetical protein